MEGLDFAVLLNGLSVHSHRIYHSFNYSVVLNSLSYSIRLFFRIFILFLLFDCKKVVPYNICNQSFSSFFKQKCHVFFSESGQ